MPSNEFVQRRLGQKITRAALERWREDNEPLNLYLWFTEGKPLCLGCAGDGQVYSLKSESPSSSPQSCLEPLPILEGATLQSAVPGSASLRLMTDTATIELVNDCDHLVLKIDGGRAV